MYNIDYDMHTSFILCQPSLLDTQVQVLTNSIHLRYKIDIGYNSAWKLWDV